MEEVGEIVSWDKGCFLWIIDDFFSHIILSNGSQHLTSPEFMFPYSVCHLRIVFVKEGLLRLGFSATKLIFDEEVDETEIDLYDETTLHVKLGMRTGYRGERETRSGDVDIYGYFDVDDWMQCSDMMERRCEILSNGRLVVSCEIQERDIEENAGEERVIVKNETSERGPDEEESIINLKVVRKLQKDFMSLLMTREDSDVTIKVQGKEFPAHRNILRARSPVFRSMFSHEMVEKQSGVVVIDDCDPVTFKDFLKYVYTGSTRDICDKNVYQLYTASYKYRIDELKGECAEFMKNNLSVGRFCDTITLALQHKEKELVELATAFFCENAVEIVKTGKWHVFLHEHTGEGNQLFMKLLSGEKILKK